jgi:TetR/AcrR family transcriptional regulator
VSDPSARGGGPNPEATRARIVAIARRVFAERGFDGTSMSLLAREAGVTQSLIHHHFGSKRDLWNHLKEGYAAEYLQVHDAGTRPAEEDPLGAWARRLFAFWSENPELLRLSAWAELDADAELPARLRAAVQEDDAMFRGLQREGRIRDDVDPLHARVLIAQCASGWLRSRRIQCAMAGHDPDDPELDRRYLRDLVAVFTAGLAPAAGRRGIRDA